VSGRGSWQTTTHDWSATAALPEISAWLAAPAAATVDREMPWGLVVVLAILDGE
jgi:hypothetical protein